MEIEDGGDAMESSWQPSFAVVAQSFAESLEKEGLAKLRDEQGSRWQFQTVEVEELLGRVVLMVRESLRPESAMVYFFVFPDNRPRNHNNGGYEFHVREGSAAACKAGYPKGDDGAGEAPYPVRFPNAWLKLSREGGIFRTASGQDGVSWKDYNELAVDFPEAMLIGIAVTAHDDAASTKSYISDLSLSDSAHR